MFSQLVRKIRLSRTSQSALLTTAASAALFRCSRMVATLAAAWTVPAHAQRMQAPPPGTLSQPPMQPLPPQSYPQPQPYYGQPAPQPVPRSGGAGRGTRSGSVRAQPDPYAIRGLKSYYAQFDSGVGSETIERCDPSSGSCNKPISESKYTLALSGVIGWGPLRTNDFMFMTHYKYSHNYQTNYNQWDRFTKEWFSKRKAEYFLFTTKDMLRTHEFVTDFRYISPRIQAGLFTRFTISRVGSSTFGEALEQAETVTKTENFVPYVQYKYGRLYRGQFSLPMRTEINEDDPRLSNMTYSCNLKDCSGKGRGHIFSFRLNNAFYVPQVDSIGYLDVYKMDYKFASIQNDRTRWGTALAFDFPIYWDIRGLPKLVYYKEGFIVERVRIDGFSKNPTVGGEIDAKPKLVKRDDTFLSYGVSLYWDANRNSRVDFNVVNESTKSTIAEFNIKRLVISAGYSYSLPATSTVNKRVDRFAENSYAEEF